MRKMRLELDKLQVESFSTAGVREIRGTVQAHSAYPCTVFDTCAQTVCMGGCTNDPSLRITCATACEHTCTMPEQTQDLRCEA